MSLTAAFRSVKIPRALPPKSGEAAAASASGRPSAEDAKKKAAPPWCVYLIASSRIPRTYVGVTTDFPRRCAFIYSLRQHNGELKGGAKCSCAGRPWNLACLVEGFVNRSEDPVNLNPNGRTSPEKWHAKRMNLASTQCCSIEKRR
ncbi:hypothetical protein ACP70R_047943 [Stipagrostis hirtigluma subsp. patula]